MYWENFCEDEFWNSSKTWYTEDPKFTQCFEKTVLVWIPCIFLWIFSSLEICYLLSSKQKNVPWSWLNVSKLLVTSVLFILLAGDIAISFGASIERKIVYDVNFFAALIKGISVAYSGILVFYNKKYGMHTSGLLFLFWFLLAVCGIPEFRTAISELRTDRLLPEIYGNHIIYLIYYALVVVMLLLNCPSDKPPKETLYKKTQNPCPELRASFLSQMLFSWFDGMIIQGYKKPLEEKDLWDISPENSVKEIFSVFDQHWEDTVEKCKKEKKKGSFLPPLFKTFGGMLLVAAAYRIINDFMIFVNPKLLGLMISYVKENQEPWKGILYAVLLFLSATFKTFISQQFSNRNVLISMRIQSALIPLIYKKALIISNTARKRNTVGEIMNLMSIDTLRFGDIANTINTLWSSPLQIVLSTYFLWQELGPSVLSGFLALILLIPTNAVIANYSKKLQIQIMKQKDERVKLMNEILNGIRILKLYAWEKSFEEQITQIREKELKLLKKARYLEAATTFLLYCSPIMVSLASFTTYVFVDEKNVLDASKTFVSLSLFNIMRNPLQNLPLIISNLLQMFVSVKRINNFLNAEEIDPEIVQHEKNKEYPVTIENGKFSWGEYPILEDINLKLRFNTLTAVVGSVGAGKTSLLCAILGEMDKIDGKVNTYGKVAYVPQQAWIQNATLKDNILFGRSFNKKRYDEVIEACALTTDFEILPAGDQTEIGEKGINLSGGQKQRISLARAVYADADLYLLDDPLSAVDSHVGKHIFDHVIGPKGYLRYKTKFLVTHAVTHLPQAHQILVMKDGCISEIGTYQELLNREGDFAEFLKQHVNSGCDEELGDTSELQLDENPNRLSTRISSRSSQGQLTEFQSNGSILSSGKESLKEKLEPIKGQNLIEKEKAEVGNVKWEIYNYYLKNVGFQMILIIFGIQVLTQGFEIASNAWLGQWSEDDTLMVNGTLNTGKRNMYLGVYGAMGFGQAFSIITSNIIYAIATLTAASKIHKCLLENSLRLPMFFFDITPIGRILGRFSTDMNGVDATLPSTFQNLITNTLKVCGTMVVIIYTTPMFVSVILPLFVIYYAIQRVYIATSRQLRRLVSISRSPLFSHFGESLTGLQTIRAYDQQKRFTLECHQKIDVSQSGQFSQTTSNRWLSVRLELIGNLIVFFAALFAALAKDQSPVLVGLSVSYSLQIIFTFKTLVNMVSSVETNIVSVERIKEYQDSEKEAAWEKPDNTPKIWPESGKIEFKNYGVRYRKGLDLVLKNVNVCIEPGSKVGVVGRTGAGKSSMTLGLFRLVEAAEGHIAIDGVNIAELGLQKLRSALTIIPQDPVLFAGTLRINLDPFNNHSDDELWRTLELAHLKHFVDGLSEGLQHEITEGGQNLSAGQKQLICLARALLRKTKILVLDEATAAIDLETDDLLQETIRKEFRDCTVLTIAHRLNTIMDSDRIIVLDKGRIVEYDSPKNLIENTESIFHGMCNDAGLC